MNHRITAIAVLLSTAFVQVIAFSPERLGLVSPPSFVAKTFLPLTKTELRYKIKENDVNNEDPKFLRSTSQTAPGYPLLGLVPDKDFIEREENSEDDKHGIVEKVKEKAVATKDYLKDKAHSLKEGVKDVFTEDDKGPAEENLGKAGKNIDRVVDQAKTQHNEAVSEAQEQLEDAKVSVDESD